MEPATPEPVRVSDVATSPHPPYDDMPPYPVFPQPNPELVPDEDEDLNAKEFPPPNVPIPPDPHARPHDFTEAAPR